MVQRGCGCTVEPIEALAAHGLAFERFVRAFDEAPRLADDHVAMMPSPLEPVTRIAVHSYETGLRLARLHRAFGDASRACAQGLVRLRELAPDEELVSRRAWWRPPEPPGARWGSRPSRGER